MTRLSLTGVTLFLAIEAHAQYSGQFIWRSRPGGPSAREAHAMAYDALRGKTVLFGGLDLSGGQRRADTWEWDGTIWTALGPANSPSARRYHAIAYEIKRGRTLLFGGQDASTRLADTWEWDGTNWTQRSPATSPPPREQHAIAYDSLRGRVVLFGGLHSLGALSDTWEWDGTNWTQRFVGGFPPARYGHALAYDSLRGRTVLFGGVSSGGASLGDTWEWDGNAWTQGSSLNARSYPALAFSSARGRTVLFGGLSSNAYEGDTWEWDGTSWTRRLTLCNCPCVPGPGGRYRHALAYDSARNRTLLFAGGGASNYADAWEYESSNQPPPCSTLGLGRCPGGVSVTCSTPPRIGSNFCVTFASEAAFSLLYIGLPTLPVPYSSPAVCNAGFLYTVPLIVLQVLGNPAVFCVPVPNEQALVGQVFGVQGAAYGILSCFHITNGVAALVQP